MSKFGQVRSGQKFKIDIFWHFLSVLKKLTFWFFLTNINFKQFSKLKKAKNPEPRRAQLWVSEFSVLKLWKNHFKFFNNFLYTYEILTLIIFLIFFKNIKITVSFLKMIKIKLKNLIMMVKYKVLKKWFFKKIILTVGI